MCFDWLKYATQASVSVIEEINRNKMLLYGRS
jgi:hypothetical protein